MKARRIGAEHCDQRTFGKVCLISQTRARHDLILKSQGFLREHLSDSNEQHIDWPLWSQGGLSEAHHLAPAKLCMP